MISLVDGSKATTPRSWRMGVVPAFPERQQCRQLDAFDGKTTAGNTGNTGNAP